MDGFLAYLLIGLCAYFAIAGWFYPMRFTVLAGDDLRSFSAAQQGFGALSHLLASVYRFRPGAAAAITLVVKYTGADFRAAAMIGVAIHTANALLFFTLLRRMLWLTPTLSLGITLIAFCSRFATYLFIQEEAITEGLAFSALLIILMLSLRFIQEPTNSRSFGLSLAYLAIIHLHERYLVLVCPLVLLAAAAFFVKRKPALWLVAAVVIITAANLAVKRWWLATPILVGTTTHAIDFNPSQIGLFLWWGTLNLFGINRGPAYLSLEDFFQSPHWVQTLSLITAILTLSLLVIGLRTLRSIPAGEPKRKSWVTVIFLAVTCFLLLLAASITIRQELRWVFSSYLVFVTLLSWILSRGDLTKWPVHLAFSTLIVLSVGREMYLARLHSHYFGFGADQTAMQLYSAITSVGKTSDYNKIVVQGEVSSENWVIMGDEFSRMNHLPPIKMESGKQPTNSAESNVLTIVYNAKTNAFYPITGGGFDCGALQNAAARLPPESQRTNPTKKAIFAMPFDHFDCEVAVAPAETIVAVPKVARHLRLSFSHIYSLGDGVNVELNATTPTGKKVLLAKVVAPLRRQDSAQWEEHDFELPEGSRQIELRVYSGSGEGTADWLAFRDFCFR